MCIWTGRGRWPERGSLDGAVSEHARPKGSKQLHVRTLFCKFKSKIVTYAARGAPIACQSCVGLGRLVHKWMGTYPVTSAYRLRCSAMASNNTWTCPCYHDKKSLVTLGPRSHLCHVTYYRGEL